MTDNWHVSLESPSPAITTALEGIDTPLPDSFFSSQDREEDAEVRLLVVRRAGSDDLAGAVLLEYRPAPLLPDHYLVKATRFGRTLPREAFRPALEHLASEVGRDRRTLRLTLNLFTPEPEERAAAIEALEAEGYRPSDDPDGYEHTLVMDLRPDIEDVLASLHRSARRNVRQVEKRPVEVRAIEDPNLVARMHALSEETFSRTGGQYDPIDWAGRIREAAERPDRARLVGVFLEDDPRPEALLAFARGRGHGDHAEYSDSASTASHDTRIAMAYPLVWDLAEWAKGWGATWFDLGGVTLGEGEDPLAGISDFKRFFSKDVRHIGGTWQFPPSTLKAKLAQAVQPAVARLREARAGTSESE